MGSDDEEEEGGGSDDDTDGETNDAVEEIYRQQMRAARQASLAEA